MRAVVYLVFGPKRPGGGSFTHNGFRRATTGQPALRPGERAVRLEVNIPDKFFEPAGTPTAKITVPEGMLSEPVPEVELLPFPEGRGPA